MNILKIKNTQGNWVDIPALKGDKGDKGDPGISPTIDSTLSQANQAADAKAVGDKIDEITLTIDETLTQSGQVADAKVTGDALNAKADQNGYYENLNVGVADQLASKNYIEDNEPYTFRPIANGAKVGTREFDTIVGGSIVWNQIAECGEIAWSTSGYKGIYVTKVDDSTVHVSGTSTDTAQARAFYIPSTKYKITERTDHVFYISSSDSRVKVYVGSGSPSQERITKPPSINDNGLVFKIDPNVDFGESGVDVQVYLFDLTQMFGSEIADYLYELDRAELGTGVAWFRKYFPNSHYECNPGELIHVSGVSAHKTYDADENIIGNYPLDSSLTLRGIPKLVDGHLSFDGDIYKPDGTVERRYGIVDLGTLTWTRGTVTNRFVTNFLMAKRFPNLNTSAGKRKQNLVTSKYVTVSGDDGYEAVYDKAISGSYWNGRNYLQVNDKTYADAASFKSAMSGVYLVYELAEPTTETTQPYQSPQIIDPYGTEEYVTTSLIPVGHQTQYPEDLRAKIESLPWDFANLIAPVETTYIATKNYTAGSLFIVDNILYKATANIANSGAITPNTNCTPTTLAEIITAL